VGESRTNVGSCARLRYGRDACEEFSETKGSRGLERGVDVSGGRKKSSDPAQLSLQENANQRKGGNEGDKEE